MPLPAFNCLAHTSQIGGSAQRKNGAEYLKRLMFLSFLNTSPFRMWCNSSSSHLKCHMCQARRGFGYHHPQNSICSQVEGRTPYRCTNSSIVLNCFIGLPDTFSYSRVNVNTGLWKNTAPIDYRDKQQIKQEPSTTILCSPRMVSKMT